MKPEKRTFRNTYLEDILKVYQQGGTVTGGDVAACHAYLQSNERGFMLMVVEKPPIEPEVFRDMLATFEIAGLHEFILADPTAELMEHLHICSAEGYDVVGPFTHQVNRSHIIKGLFMRKK